MRLPNASVSARILVVIGSQRSGNAVGSLTSSLVKSTHTMSPLTRSNPRCSLRTISAWPLFYAYYATIPFTKVLQAGAVYLKMDRSILLSALNLGVQPDRHIAATPRISSLVCLWACVALRSRHLDLYVRGGQRLGPAFGASVLT
jgi:hypothetical protein